MTAAIISTLIFQCYQQSGQLINHDDLKTQTKLLLENYNKFFHNLNDLQVNDAFEKGRNEQYGKNYGYNVKTYTSWLKAKQDELKGKQPAGKYPFMNPPQAEEKKIELTEEEKHKSDVAFYNKLKKQVADGKEILTVRAAYDLLVRRGLITPNKYEAFVLQAEAEAMEGLQKMLTEAEAEAKQTLEIKKAIENLMSGPDSKIISDAKLRSVVEYFNGVK